MTNVILQPASGKEPREHYRDTVESLVALPQIRPHLSNSAYESLSTAVSADSTCVWGIRPSMVSQWNKIQVGDKVMFARTKKFFSLSTVTWKVRSYSLAKDLWDVHDSGDTWEFIYFFGSPEDLDIPYTDINAVVPDRKPGAVPQGVTVLSSTKADAVFELLDETIVGDPVAEVKSAVRGQGFNSSSKSRVAVELAAMKKAIAYYQNDGWHVDDMSSNNPYDLKCTKPNGVEIHVEVKGTTSDGSSA